jgi:hypothetical protein
MADVPQLLPVGLDEEAVREVRRVEEGDVGKRMR